MSPDALIEAAPTDLPTPVPEPRWVQVLLLIVAALSTIGALSGVAAVIADWSEPSGLDPVIAAANIVRLPLAIAAIVFASRRDLRAATMAMAGVVMANSVGFLPSTIEFGFNVTDAGFYGVVAAAQVLVYPFLAIAAGVLAWRNLHLTRAAVLACVPMTVDTIGVAMFAASVAIYGF